MGREPSPASAKAGEKRYTNCTTAGAIFAYVRDGRIIRVEPLHVEPEEAQLWKVTVNGKTYTPPLKTPLLYWGTAARKIVYSENRVKYPLKRIDWDPHGGIRLRRTENRGKSQYVRISWDEAFNILEHELKRVRETYGSSAVLATYSPHPDWGALHYFFSDFFRFWNLLGHTPLVSSPMSWEGWVSGAAFMYGHFMEMGCIPSPDSLQDISENSELIVLWGVDSLTHNIYHGIDQALVYAFWKELGKKVILIDPYFNDTGAAYSDKWIPIIPGTDCALAAAIAYIWITEKTYDKEYLDTHAIGFDEEHLPTEAPPGTSFKNYILGISDGIPKTPEWAAGITGVPSRTIKELAREWASRPTALSCMFSGACRRAYAHEWTRFMVTLQTMQGLGRPGVCLMGAHTSLSGPYDHRQKGPRGYADGGMNLVTEPGIHIKHAPPFPHNPVSQLLAENILDKAIFDPPVRWRGGTVFNPNAEFLLRERQYPESGASEVRMLWQRGSSHMCAPEFNRDISLYKSPRFETIVVQAPWFDRSCRYADIVLPTTTNFERNDLTEPGKPGTFIPPTAVNMRLAVFHQKCIESVGESMTDLEIFAELADRLGIKDAYTEGNSEDDLLRKLYGLTNIPMSYEEFKEKGYFVWNALPDYKPCKQLKLFYEDPQNNPVETPSGKIEIFSRTLFRYYGADNPEIPPVPHYIPDWEGRYSQPLVERYPLQLLTVHPKFRFHGKYDDVSWFNEIYKVRGPDGYEYEPIYMNPADARARSLKNGDIVRVFNARGQILCGVRTTERFLQGVVWVAYGSWYDPLEDRPGAIDRAGNSNFLTPARSMSAHHIGFAFNSVLVEVEKADLEKLAKTFPNGWAGKYRTNRASSVKEE
jgi:trimethylamine-N-oxide reductase (cytochrome c)